MDAWRMKWPVEGKTAFVFLAAFRGCALIIGVALLSSLGYFRFLTWPGWTLIGIITIYTIFKLSRPFNRYKKNSLNYADFAFDLSLCLALPLFTGGLRSPFLLYCFAPVLTSALIFPKKFTFSIAGLPFLAVFLSQLLIRGTSMAEVFNPPELSFGLLAIYLVVSFLFAWLPYVMNINVPQKIRAQAIVEERSRLSRGMHDGLAQSLGVIGWKMELLWKTIASGDKMQSLNQLSDISQIVDETQQEARAVIDELRTSVKHDKGFVPNLAQCATDFTQQYGIRCELHVCDGLVKLPSLAELELLYVVQEAMNNVRKHAKASLVQVSLESKSDGTEITIRDNGHGFDPKTRTQGHGLAVMEERVRSVGGKLSVNTSPGQGTQITVKLPNSQSL